jgi:aspartyl-tRNA(Asn)/glutamyl-tRNA(Gln) amidotransferase subunit C
VPDRFTREDVKAIASLASLELTDAESDLFARQLGQILEYAEEVQRVDTSGVPPTASVVTRHEADRDDVPQPSLDRDLALANAPDRSADGRFFKVPRVIG